SRMTTSDSWFRRLLESMAGEENISLSIPIKNLDEDSKVKLLYGIDDQIFTAKGTNRFGRMTSYDTKWEGIIKNLERRFRETDSDFMRQEIEKYMRFEPCPECKGARLKKESLAITIKEKNISQISAFSIKEAASWANRLASGAVLSDKELQIAGLILKEIANRLQFLLDVGLDYLTLDRPASTLAGGEAQRIRLASQIGSGLTGVIYVLDEPSIGLHQRDNKRLIGTLKKLRDLGNTVIVVEHDREVMENADLIIDFGPGAGERGGEIIAVGTPEEIKLNPSSLTGAYLSGRRVIKYERNGLSPFPASDKTTLALLGCRHHNLKNIDVSFPLGKFVCVTGVSGSGKSTLINDILYHALMEKFYSFHRGKPGEYDGILGEENLNRVVLIDQSPIGRTPRSNPATYTGVFTFIRELFAKTLEAREKGYSAGRFSFNVKGGRCETCQGEGQIKIEMQFLPDVYIDCEVCGGKRYNREALEILYKGKNIAEVLALSVDEAFDFFANIPRIRQKLEVLSEVGLGYIKLGQPATTLSGGEAQRVKLATELAKQSVKRTLYLLDEPTTGLHFADLEKLLLVLKKLVVKGNTVIVIEHHLDIIKNADWIIDLGPEGGEEGGYLVAEGLPSEVAKNKNSH
ncbi:MAG: excinuclease ABC subunit UvrA, partial [bacterium]|nr:excinuclease ABC subunit UvrA [bacterium]